MLPPFLLHTLIYNNRSPSHHTNKVFREDGSVFQNADVDLLFKVVYCLHLHQCLIIKQVVKPVCRTRLAGACCCAVEPFLVAHTQLLKTFLDFHESERSLPSSQEPTFGLYIEPDESNQYPPSIFPRSILILFCHQRQSLPSSLFPSGFPTKNFYIFFIFPKHGTCSTLVTLPDLVQIIFGEECKLWSFSLCAFRHPSYLSQFKMFCQAHCSHTCQLHPSLILM